MVFACGADRPTEIKLIERVMMTFGKLLRVGTRGWVRHPGVGALGQSFISCTDGVRRSGSADDQS